MVLRKRKFEFIVDNNAFRATLKALSNGKYIVDFGKRKYITRVEKRYKEGNALVYVDDELHHVVVEQDNNDIYIYVDGKPTKINVKEHLNLPGLGESDLRPLLSQQDKKKFVSLGTIVSPFYGKLVELKIKVGDRVKKGQTIAVIEAMKMRNEIVAKVDGVVRDLRAKVGKVLRKDEPIAMIK